MRHRLEAAPGRVVSGRVSKRARYCLAAMGLAALMAVASGHGAETKGADQASWLGKAAPEFTLTNLSGGTVRLSDFKGKMHLIKERRAD